MPVFERLSKQEIEMLSQRKTSSLDLGEYTDYLKGLKTNDWGAIKLGRGESPRSIRRRVTMAANGLGVNIQHVRNKDDDRVLFRMVEPGSGKRAKRKKAA